MSVDDAIVMDKKTFKSLTSDTRLKILKLLKKRNHTITEIAEKLGIKKSSVKQHIDILVEGRLVEPVPSSNIWKYYTLTNDGKKLVEDESPKRVVVLLATTIIGLLMMFYGFSSYFFPPMEESNLEKVQTLQADGGPEMVRAAPKSALQQEPASDYLGDYLSALRPFIGFVGALLIIIAIFELSKKRETLI